MTTVTAFGSRPFVEETVDDVDRHLTRLRGALRREHPMLSSLEREALRLRLLDHVDRWLDCRLSLTQKDEGA